MCCDAGAKEASRASLFFYFLSFFFVTAPEDEWAQIRDTSAANAVLNNERPPSERQRDRSDQRQARGFSPKHAGYLLRRQVADRSVGVITEYSCILVFTFGLVDGPAGGSNAPLNAASKQEEQQGRGKILQARQMLETSI